VPSVLITGASRGIGRACALRLDRRGFDVIAGVRSEEAGRRLAGEASGRLRVVRIDVADPESVRAGAGVVGDRLDVLVNNAGIAVGGIVEALPLDDLRRQFEVNVVGQVGVTQAVLPALRAASGRIVFISSANGRASVPVLTSYSASKFALEAIADGLRVELRPWGIDVVLVEPGSIDTDISRAGEEQLDSTVTGRLYGPLLSGTRKLVAATAKRAAPVEKVVDVIERAATADRPRARYVVGADARAQIALRTLLPARAYDALLARMLGV
jgi:NAD(P)-dependent dehydrogenase (short-subunit alcohol dehydrogenase family)